MQKSVIQNPQPHSKKTGMQSLSVLKIVFMLTLLLGAILIVGCTAKPAATEPPTVLPTEPPPPTQAPVVVPTAIPEPVKPGVDIGSAEYEAILAAYKNTKMGNTYDIGKGPNTYCSRCHSPQNWDPTSTTDRPPNCVTCKFPTDEEMRVATTMDFVAEEDWVGISCETCHVVEGDRVLTENAWFNPLTKEHETVATTEALCAKCHADTKGVSASGGRGVEHAIILGGSAHLNWGGALPQEQRPDQCSDCHNPHTMEVKGCVDCHADVMTMENHAKGTMAQHANLECQACHDASGAEVGPFPADAENPRWTTILTSVGRSGATTSVAVKSHSSAWLVDCSRCHFEANPWELTVLTADGKVPEPPAPPAK
ncbi:MAG: hypothetical protein BGO78_12860 [Chloroflexi bacterium 44-23]|nr:MAG: hypothetical protein BGO78_12860 [Chloroflexi bacterium 44-23]